MGLAKREVVFLVMIIMVGNFGLSVATAYDVGGSNRWTVPGSNFSYQNWADSNKFFLNDVRIFNYVSRKHNVMRVNVEDFKSCNSDTPLAVYRTGADAVQLESLGEYYFICGFPGHCQAGQKFHITVNSSAAASPPILPLNNNNNVPASRSIASKLSYQLAMAVAVAVFPSFLLLI